MRLLWKLWWGYYENMRPLWKHEAIMEMWSLCGNVSTLWKGVYIIEMWVYYGNVRKLWQYEDIMTIRGHYDNVRTIWGHYRNMRTLWHFTLTWWSLHLDLILVAIVSILCHRLSAACCPHPVYPSLWQTFLTQLRMWVHVYILCCGGRGEDMITHKSSLWS